MLDEFLTSEKTEMRLLRSVVQGLVSVLIVAVPLILGGVIEDATWASIATAAIMCVLSPLMAMMRTGNPEDGTVDAE
ncbi:MAG: hypothetical protein Q4B91_03570 [Atopobiaceae bacterium]|nr:hypothetical protein [Atopobiaceae bacterium]